MSKHQHWSEGRMMRIFLSCCCLIPCFNRTLAGAPEKAERTGGSQIITFEMPAREADGGGMGDIISHLPPGITGVTNANRLKQEVVEPLPTLEESLFLAAGDSDPGEVRRLIDAGAKVNGRHRLTGMTPLMACSTRASAEILLAHKADPQARDGAGATALHHVLFAAEAVSLVPLLIKHGADVNAVAERQHAETPLLAARQLFFEGRDPRQAEAIVRALVAAGADVNAADDAGDTMLTTAACNRKPEMVKLLLSLGADASRRNKEGMTALGLARSLGFSEITELLAAAETKE